jgi:hypothetical protein
MGSLRPAVTPCVGDERQWLHSLESVAEYCQLLALQMLEHVFLLTCSVPTKDTQSRSYMKSQNNLFFMLHKCKIRPVKLGVAVIAFAEI